MKQSLETPTVLPDFFIIGAPKSGTTALAHYLRGHSSIVVSRPKEPHYFSTDIHDRLRIVKTAHEYDACFTETNENQLRGEASVLYLYSHDAIPNILAVKPDAKFIVMLRNPVAMARSLHLQNLTTGIETESDFETIWNAQKNQTTHTDPDVRRYAMVCQIGSQLMRARSLIDPANLHIIIFDDFIKNTQSEYQAVLTFLGVADDGRTDFAHIKAARRRRSVWLHKALIAFHDWALPIRKLLRAIGITNAGAPISWLRRWNSPAATPTTISPTLEAELAAWFAPEISLVAEATDRPQLWQQ